MVGSHLEFGDAYQSLSTAPSPSTEMMAPSSSESSLHFVSDSLLCCHYLTVMALSLSKSAFYILLGLSIVMSTGSPSSHVYNHGASGGEGI